MRGDGAELIARRGQLVFQKLVAMAVVTGDDDMIEVRHPADQIAHRRKRPGRPTDFGDEQRERYKGRNVVERCFNFVKQWRGLASRYDKTARSYAAGICLSAALQWI